MSICVYFNATIFNVKKRKLKEKNEESSKLPSSLSSMCMMQSTSIEKNDTLNYIERLFFCCSEPTVWCDDVLRPCYCVCVCICVNASKKAKVMNKRGEKCPVSREMKKKKRREGGREEGRKENWPSLFLFVYVWTNDCKKNC